MRTRPVQKHLAHVLLLSLIVLLLGGGVALLDQWQQGPTPSHASDDNVVGPPSLPAADVDAIFKHLGSPMVGTGQAIEDAARAQNIDDAFALAVWWTETNDGAAGVGRADRNPGSVRGSTGYPSAYDGYTIYPSYSAAVNYWFGMMKKVYINRGLTTVSAICHPYVGTSTANLWAGKVITLMNRYRAAAPPSTTTIANANIARHARALDQLDQGVVYPQTTLQVQDTRPQQDSSNGLSGNTKSLLVLFDLVLALALGLWARSMLKRYGSSPQVASLAGGTLQQKWQAAFQQPAAAFLQPFAGNTGPARTTEGLSWPAPMTGALAATNVSLSAYSSSDALLPLGAFMATQAQGQGYGQHTQQPFTGQLSSFNTPAPGAPQTARLPGLGLPSRPMPQSSPLASNPLHRTRLMPSRPTAEQFPTSGAYPNNPPQPQPQPVAGGVGGGRTNGLLSRYRETQTQSGEQRSF